MLTVKQIEKQWKDNSFARLLETLTSGRAEFPAGVLSLVSKDRVALAAMGASRLYELQQSHTPLYGKLIDVVRSKQQPGGSYGNAVTTALAIVALSKVPEAVFQVALAVDSLKAARRDEGGWSHDLLPRMPLNLEVSAFVVGTLAGYRPAVEQLDLPTVEAMLSNLVHRHDMATRRLLSLARARFGARPAAARNDRFLVDPRNMDRPVRTAI